jgi:uncharacterized membrane protein
MKTKAITGIMALALMLMFGAGNVGTAEAQTSDMLKMVGTIGGIVNICIMDLIMLPMMPFDLCLTAISFLPLSSMLNELVIDIGSIIFMIAFSVAYMFFDAAGITGLFISLLDGLYSDTVWFVAKRNYWARILFMSGEQAFGEVF